MSATHFGCGCLINRDGTSGELVTVAPCARHRWVLQPELEALEARVRDLRARDAAAAEPTPDAASDGPDIEVVFVAEDPLELIRRLP